MNKRFAFIVGIFVSVSFICLALYTSVYAYAFSAEFFEKEFDKLNIAPQIKMEKDELMKVTKHMLDYLLDKEENLNINTVVAGEERAFFNERELSHMVDVKELFKVGSLIKYIGFTVLTLGCLFILGSIYKKHNWKEIAQNLIKGFSLTLLAFCIFITVLIVIISLNFESAFTIFHQLFFNNELWILDPQTDLLINIVPLQFFIDIATKIAIMFSFFIFVAVVVSFFSMRLLRKKGA